MGDVVHAMPVVTDILVAHPEARIDWIVEEAFADLPALHPGVTEVIPVAVRRWRRTPLSGAVRREIGDLRRRLRANRYTLALDLQGLYKSAWLARLTGAPVAGFDRSSAREPLASLAYRHRYPVPRDLHAIERLRCLAAQALGHRPQGLPRFGLVAPTPPPDWSPTAPYVVALHATSRDEKRWPVADWVDLGGRSLRHDLAMVLPWGSAREREAAEAIARAVRGLSPDGDAGDWAQRVQVAPRMGLRECARLLAGAHAVCGVDTGLTHLAAALGAPTVALFAATEAWRYGPLGSPRARALGEDGRWPSADEVWPHLMSLAGAPGEPAGP